MTLSDVHQAQLSIGEEYDSGFCNYPPLGRDQQSHDTVTNIFVSSPLHNTHSLA